MLSAVLQGSMTRHDILWNLPLSEGREYQAAWWMFYVEQAHSFGVTHGIDVSRVSKAKKKDLIG